MRCALIATSDLGGRVFTGVHAFEEKGNQKSLVC